MLLTFKQLTHSWDLIRKNREEELFKIAPDMTSLAHVYLKLLRDEPDTMTIQFSGLESSVNNTSNIPQVKNLLRDWIGRVSTSVQIRPSAPNTLVLRISKTSDILEHKPVVKMSAPVIAERKYERDLGLNRVRIIAKS